MNRIIKNITFLFLLLLTVGAVRAQVDDKGVTSTGKEVDCFTITPEDRVVNEYGAVVTQPRLTRNGKIITDDCCPTLVESSLTDTVTCVSISMAATIQKGTFNSGTLQVFSDASYSTLVSQFTASVTDNKITAKAIGLTCYTRYYFKLTLNGQCEYVWTDSTRDATLEKATFCTVANIRTTAVSETDLSREHLVSGSTNQIDSVYDHQGNRYAVVQIGNQCWLKENMRCTTSPTGILNRGNTGSNNTTPYYYCPSENVTFTNGTIYTPDQFKEKFGLLYNFPGTMDINTAATSFSYPHRGICPEGWHVPTDAELTTLADSAGVGNTESGTGLGKLAGGCDWNVNNEKATCPGNYSYANRNESGFSALPAGRVDGDGFHYYGNVCDIWSATPAGSDKAWWRSFYASSTYAMRSDHTRGNCVSVRCVRDYECDVVPETSCNVLQKLSNEHQSAAGIIDSVYDHEGNDYSVVQIGDQCWLKENMRCTTSPKGLLSEGKATTASHQMYCDYSTATQFTLRERGFLYTWAGAMDTAATAANKNYENRRGICPLGWHLPTDAEWTTLFTGLSVGTSSSGNGAGKLTGGCEWNEIGMSTSPNSYTYADRNSSGFTALPIGSYNGNECTLAGQRAIFWSATSSGTSSQAYDWSLDYNKEYATRTGRNMYHGRSVRCLRNTPTSATISFHANGGTGSMPAMNVMTMKDTVLDALNGITHGGNFEFAGWNTKMDGSGTAYTDGATFTPTESITLYAQWNSWCDAGQVMSNERGTDRVDSVMDYQNNWYKVVQINGICVLKENLRVVDTTPSGKTMALQTGLVPQAMRYAHKDLFGENGYLYNWCSAMDTTGPVTAVSPFHRGICPLGWHIPATAEWNTLLAGNKSGSYAAFNDSYLGAPWTANSTANVPGNINDPYKDTTGFSAIPVGYFGNDNTMTYGNGTSANYWTATIYNTSAANSVSLSNNSQTVAVNEEPTKGYGYSVRCVRNYTALIISSDKDDISDLKLCGGQDVVYTAEVQQADVNVAPTGYKWSVNNVDSTSVTNTLSCLYAVTGTYNVRCVAYYGDNDSLVATKATKITSGGTTPTLGLCEDCEAGSIIVKSNNCTSLTWVNNDDQSKTVTTTGTTGISVSEATPAGVYTVTGVNADGCTVTRTVTLGDYVAHPCTVNSKNDNELGRTDNTIDSVADHEGNWYKVVQIGDQCWLAENMRATTNVQGESILQNPASSLSNVEPRAFYYSDNIDYYNKYGCLYNFPAAMNGSTSEGARGICPEGWHIPRDGEWFALEKEVLGLQPQDSSRSEMVKGSEVGRLIGGCDWTSSTSSNYAGNYSYPERNSYGFSAFPAGYYGGSFNYVTQNAFFWSSTQTEATKAQRRVFAYNSNGIKRSGCNLSDGLSVRCLRDYPIPVTISFHANGGSGTMTAMNVTTMKDTVLDANTFTHDGNFEFAGWGTDQCGSEIVYTDGASITPTESITLYAQWNSYCSVSSVRAQSGSDLSSEHSYNGSTTQIDSVYDHEGNAYSVVQIGEQCWLKENMRCTTSPRQGTGNGQVNLTYATTATHSYDMPYYYNYNTTSGTDPQVVTDSCMRGYLYNWVAAMDTSNTNNITDNLSNRRGLCPKGWHIPSDDDWNTLADSAFVGRSQGTTGLGKLTGGCDWSTSGSGSQPGNYSYSERNSTGFSVLPVGSYYSSAGGAFSDAGKKTSFWSSTSNSNSYAYYRNFIYNYEYVYHEQYHDKDYGHSVRCVRNTPDTITFMSHDGTGVTKKQVVKTGEQTQLEANTFARNNFSFTGWSTDPSGCADTQYADEDNITTHGNVTLYAQWDISFCSGNPTSNESGNGRIDSVKDHQNNWYKVVQIGNQCWLKENMRATTSPRQGTGPGQVNLQPGTGLDQNNPKYYDYNTQQQVVTNPRERGLLYNWVAAMDTAYETQPTNKDFLNRRGICPAGWHLPTDEEWFTLEKNVLSGISATSAATSAEDYRGAGAGKLAGGCSWNGTGNSTSLNTYSYVDYNSTGFSALPVGNYNTKGFELTGKNADFWNATSTTTDKAYYRTLYCDYGGVARYQYGKSHGRSVRCVRNVSAPATISFHANGGSGSMEAMNVTTMKDTVLKDNSFTHGGNFEFAGWNTKMDGSGTAYTDGGNIVPTESMTLYAQWHTYCAGTPLNNELGTSRIDSVKDHENNWYKVVQIGNQCWLKENLRTENVNNKGNVYTPTNQQTPGYNVTTYGRLYDWAAVMQGANASTAVPSGVRGICPEGWHVPSANEWDTLTYHVFSNDDYKCGCNAGSVWTSSAPCIANALSAATGWTNSALEGCNAGNASAKRNLTGFSVIPVGYYHHESSTVQLSGNYAYFWSATDFSFPNRRSRTFCGDYSNVIENYGNEEFGFSVRCVRNN